MASRRVCSRLSHLLEDLAGNGERVGSALRQVGEIMILAAWVQGGNRYIIGSWSPRTHTINHSFFTTEHSYGCTVQSATRE